MLQLFQAKEPEHMQYESRLNCCKPDHTTYMLHCRNSKQPAQKASVILIVMNIYQETNKSTQQKESMETELNRFPAKQALGLSTKTNDCICGKKIKIQAQTSVLCTQQQTTWLAIRGYEKGSTYNLQIIVKNGYTVQTIAMGGKKSNQTVKQWGYGIAVH
jgi:hypothetical protein